METIKLFILTGLIACFIQACNIKAKTEPVAKTPTSERTCYVPYEINPLNNNDTINRMFYDGTKIGHWIVFQWVTPKGELQMGTAKRHGRAKLEEGNYVNGKKEGYWKSYRQDGRLRDSVLFNNGEGGC